MRALSRVEYMRFRRQGLGGAPVPTLVARTRPRRRVETTAFQIRVDRSVRALEAATAARVNRLLTKP